MVEWNIIFRLFRFSQILGQPREVHPKFRKISFLFAPPPGISGIFGPIEKRPLLPRLCGYTWNSEEILIK